MPELPEVETVRRVIERALLGQVLTEVELPEDPILLQKRPAEPIRELLLGATVTGVGRKGKFWWIELDRKPWVFGHLGMAGWIREIGEFTIRLKEHGTAPLDDETGRPRFLRLMLTGANGRRIAFTDGRRLGRLWLADSPEDCPRTNRLGPDIWQFPPNGEEIQTRLKGRKAPIKAMLLDQELFCGVGNWIADEVLFHSRIAPARAGGSLSAEEADLLAKNLFSITDLSVNVGANSEDFPKDWLFHYRWGGDKGHDSIDGHLIIREQIGGRTTAWCPNIQK